MGKALSLKNDVQKRRIYFGITQKELADNVGCSVSNLQLIEKNKTTPHSNLRFRLAEFFLINEDQLFYKEEKNVSTREKNISKANRR